MYSLQLCSSGIFITGLDRTLRRITRCGIIYPTSRKSLLDFATVTFGGLLCETHTT